MTPVQAIGAFSLAAALLTITPGLDTALVLRTAATDGPKRAAQAGLGIVAGCLVWGAAAAFGLAAVLAASHTVFLALKLVGAAYLVWTGIGLLVRPRKTFDMEGEGTDRASFRRGLLTNLLNPKVGVFYVSFLPQFLPRGVAAGSFLFGLAAIHAVFGVAWFAALIAATRPLGRALRESALVTWLDRITGGVFIGFGLKLALDRS